MVEEKDIRRLQDIGTKSSGDLEKMKSLARHMTSLIKDREKAMRRWEAAIMIYGHDHPVTMIFDHRRKILSGLGCEAEAIVPVMKAAITKKKMEELEPVMERGSVIDPDGGYEIAEERGFVHLKKGFEGAYVEHWRAWDGSNYLIATESYGKLGSIANFSHEGVFLFGGELVDWVSFSNSSELKLNVAGKYSR